MKPLPPSVRLPFRRGLVEFNLGSEADHEAVYQTLLHVFHGPDRESFLGALSDPAYRPDQRLLAKVDGRVVSHLHLTDRQVRYGRSTVKMNGVMWVGTLPEYRGLGFAQNLMRLADEKARERSVPLQALTTGMPQFYKPLGWGICGRQTTTKIASRNLPAGLEGSAERKGEPWQVRPWRQVELGDLMKLYETQYATTNGTIVRDEEYWRWMIGRRYAHVIWVACLGEAVHGYAFVKDHKILEIAFDPEKPSSLPALLGRIRAEALERAYPEVVLSAPSSHPAVELLLENSGKLVDQDELEGATSMYHAPDVGKLLEAIAPELRARVVDASQPVPFELGLSVDDERWMVHVARSSVKIERDRLSRRHLTLRSGAFVRLALGHTGIDAAMEEDGVEASTATAIEAARVLFPVRPVWRSPLDSATA